MGPVNINESVEAVQRLVAFNLERKKITLEMDLESGLPLVSADRQLIQEVIMNLMLNAVDAVQENGFIRVATFSRVDQVVLEIMDRGHGIPPQQIDQIFDPFFTTKKAGEGTGLGLSISLGIVQAHGGNLVVTSEPGVETTFTISLPAADFEDDRQIGDEEKKP